MKFTTTIEIDTDKDSPNIIGEFLRGRFWPPQKEYDFGCYSTFEYGSGVKELPSRPVEVDDIFEWKRAEWEGIICEWYWDGDGVLRFILPSGAKVINTDCKKEHNWEWESEEDLWG